MTNYQSTSYHTVNEDEQTSLAFSTLPPEAPGVPDTDDYVMKAWHTAFLPDGQPVAVAVYYNTDDVRGLQSFLNDQFGRGVKRLPDSAEDTVRTALNNLLADGYRIVAPNGAEMGSNNVPFLVREPGWGTAPDGAATWNPLEAQRAAEALGDDQAANQFLDAMQSASEAIGQMQIGTAIHAWAERNPLDAVRQCPYISNGVQCTGPEGHETAHHVQGYALPALQTGDGAATPPAAPMTTPGATGGEQAAESATGAPTSEVAPSPFAPYKPTEQELAANEAAKTADPEAYLAAQQTAEPAKKKVNRRKKEEIAYDNALEAFRKQPTSQLEYTALTQAAEALRKRFPNASRLEAYDLHVQMQDVGPLLKEPQGQPTEMRDPVAGKDYMSDSSPVPHFAPEPSAEPIPAPQPIALPTPQDVTPEETAAAQAFPCQHISEISQRPCIRAAGHELANPPKPHIYAPLPDGQELPRPDFVPPVPPAGFTSTPVGTPAQDGSGFTQATIPPFQIPQPGATVLSFQIPPTPEVQGAELQPPAPAAPPWGGQQ